MTESAHSDRRIFGRAQEDHIHDPYQVKHKPHEPAVCDGCGAIYHQGRWQWGAASPEGAHRAIARPAGELPMHCRRGW